MGVSAVIKAEMEKDPDAPDYEPKKAELLKAANAVAEGGVKGDLKFKPMKTVSCRVCVTSDTKTLTADTLKKVVEDLKKAKDLVNADEAKVTEMPKKDTVTKRTCGTIAYPPKAGMKTEDVKKEFEKLEVTVRRSLAGRGLDGEVTTTRRPLIQLHQMTLDQMTKTRTRHPPQLNRQEREPRVLVRDLPPMSPSAWQPLRPSQLPCCEEVILFFPPSVLLSPHVPAQMKTNSTNQKKKQNTHIKSKNLKIAHCQSTEIETNKLCTSSRA